MQNDVYKNTLEILMTHLRDFRKKQKNIFCTSSFQTQSLPLLHIISNHFKKDIKIIFLDTGFLFPESYKYMEDLKKLLDLEVVSLSSEISKHRQIDSQTGLFEYSTQPDRCCYVNKVAPLEKYCKAGDVWISGVRRDQSAVRKQMNLIENNKNGVLKFHPMLEWSNKDVYDYIRENELPKHPLEKEGYLSIGCVPCTHKYNSKDPRGGRWLGSQKTECGLHNKN